MDWSHLMPMLARIDLHRVIDWMNIGWPGYLVMFGLLFSCGLGVPIPEDIPLLVAGMLCGQGGKDMYWPIAAVAGWAGIVGGDCVLYSFGYKYGLGITKVPLIGKHVTQKRILKAEKLFERWGVWVVAIGRLFAGIRGAMVVAAGTTRFSFVKFVIADGLAALVSGGLFLWLGYAFAQNLEKVETAIHHAGGWVFGGVAVLVVLWIVYAWWRHKKHESPSQIALDKVVGPVEVVLPPGPESLTPVGAPPASSSASSDPAPQGTVR